MVKDRDIDTMEDW